MSSVKRTDLADLWQTLASPRIAVVGDAIVDEYVWGEVERISPEAPIPVLRVARREHRAGGAGCVVTNLAHLGADVRFFSVRGDDGQGERLAELLRSPPGAPGARVGIDGLIVDPTRPTTSKTRHVGYVQHANRAMQQLLRVDDEVRKPIDSRVLEGLVEAFRAQASGLDAVLISDYFKGLVSGRLIQALREAAPSIPFLVDPALTDDYTPYRGSYLICPNRYEAGRATGLSCQDIEGCARAAERLSRELEIEAVAVTMDRDGIFVHERSGRSTHFPTHARTVADVTGAGDMVLSVLGLVTASGGGLDAAVELANVAAGIEVRRIGVVPLTRDEIYQEIRYRGHPGAGKIKALEELEPLVKAARDAGKTVVFTNGCFDLLHRGHQHLLTEASAMGDLLVVAVNSDASIRRLKGPARPKIREEDRLLDLAGLEAVDYVVRFDDDTPNRLLEALRPALLVKGEEYSGGLVAGREIVESYGGRVVFTSMVPGISTSSLLGS